VAIGGCTRTTTSCGREARGDGRARHVASFLLGKTRRRASAWRRMELWGLAEKFREVALELFHCLENLLPQGGQVFRLQLMAGRARRLSPGGGGGGGSSSSCCRVTFFLHQQHISCRLRSWGLS
jgi:hypothetical protein